MLIDNNTGKDVTQIHDQLRASMHPKKWAEMRPYLPCITDSREVLEPTHHRVGKMFQLGQRAKHNLG